MSVILLKGKIDDKKWDGQWYYAKDKYNTQSFHYEYIGKTIPSDIWNLIASVDSPRDENVTAAIPVTTPTARSSPQTDEVTSIHVASSEAASTSTASIEPTVEIAPMETPPIEMTIEHAHELCGCWQGGFIVWSTAGEVTVAETFFFYKLNSDAESPAWASQLPQLPKIDIIDTKGGDILLGFGHNAYGVFSIIGSYHSDTGTLLCERKYHHPRQTRRRHSISSASQSGGESMSTRKRSHTEIYRDYEDYAPPPSQRKRGLSWNGAATPKAETETLDQVEDGYRFAFLDEVSGETYEGGWHYGRRHGNGICVYADGSMYEGMWINGREHGHGSWMAGDRTVIYVGEWNEGKIQGHGKYTFANGDVYVGDWKEGSRHGKGEYTTVDGCRYVGDWKDNMRHGKGVFTWADGSEYSGDWECNRRHGRGDLIMANGFQYSGNWDKNQMEGRGCVTYPNQQQYQGNMKQGVREGRGSITFPEGAIYEGRFREDRLDGQGTIVIMNTVPGFDEGEKLVPIQIQADIRRIHFRAGFGDTAH